MKKGKVSVIGLVGQSAFMGAATFPQPGETISCNSLFFEIGGKGCNQALACAQMGAEAVFIGAIGKDDNGQLTKKMFHEADMEYIFFEKNIPTAFATITTDRTGENTVAVYPGAAKELSAQDLRREDFLQTLESSDYLLLQNELSHECLLAAIDLAGEEGIPVIFNPAPAGPGLEACLPKCSLITPNFAEAKALLGLTGDVSDEMIVGGFRRMGVEQGIVTDGGRGILVFDSKDSYRLSAYRAGEVVDTTGAGDVFNGTLAAFLAQGVTLREAAQRAVVAAGISVTRKGAAISVPSLREVECCLSDL